MDFIGQWNHAAAFYADAQEQSDFVRINKDVVRKRFLDLTNLSVLDAGCGYGCFTEYFRSVGAKAVGCDGSKEMIRIAREKYARCSFDLVDLSGKMPYGDGTFDLVFCNLVLMDLDRIDVTLSELSRILKDRGTFYFSIVHPAFYDGVWQRNGKGIKTAKTISRYRSSYRLENDFWGRTTHFHRPVSYYLNLAADNGLLLTHMEEPKTYDGVSKTDEIPLFLFAEFRKYGGG